MFGPGTDLVSFAEQSRTTFPNSRGRLSVILGNAADHADQKAEELLPVVLDGLGSLGVSLRGRVFGVRKVSEKDEFYALSPGCQRLHPTQKTGVKGLVLCGDYTLTRSLATMEGAVLSGKKAAKAVLS